MEMVLEQFRCPACREQRPDYLVVDPDSGEVICQSCGTQYDPLAEQEA